MGYRLVGYKKMNCACRKAYLIFSFVGFHGSSAEVTSVFVQQKMPGRTSITNSEANEDNGFESEVIFFFLL